MRIRYEGKSGSIILEIAIVAPVFLLICTFMLTAISCARADILFSQAVDQVTQELAIAVPIAGAGVDIAGVAIKYINDATSGENGSGLPSGTSPEDGSSSKPGEILTSAVGGIGAVLESLGVEAGDVFGTLLFGEGIRDRIVETFNSYNSSEKLLHSRIDKVSVYVDYDKQNKVIWLNVYYHWNTLFGPAKREMISAVPVFGDLELTLPETDGPTKPEDKVWQLSNFERGYSIRSTFGGNLPQSYPVIAKWGSNTATSIKSIDLTAPGYQTAGAVTENVREFIDELAGFVGTDQPWGSSKIDIGKGDITSRVLIVVIPSNYSAEVYNELVSCTGYAASQGIELRIEKYGNSYRYVDREDGQLTDNSSDTGKQTE